MNFKSNFEVKSKVYSMVQCSAVHNHHVLIKATGAHSEGEISHILQSSVMIQAA